MKLIPVVSQYTIFVFVIIMYLVTAPLPSKYGECILILTHAYGTVYRICRIVYLKGDHAYYSPRNFNTYYGVNDLISTFVITDGLSNTMLIDDYISYTPEDLLNPSRGRFLVIKKTIKSYDNYTKVYNIHYDIVGSKKQDTDDYEGKLSFSHKYNVSNNWDALEALFNEFN